jgi:hypothetical protein
LHQILGNVFPTKTWPRAKALGIVIVEISTNTGNIQSGIRHSRRYRTSILNYRISSLRYRTSK